MLNFKTPSLPPSLSFSAMSRPHTHTGLRVPAGGPHPFAKPGRASPEAVRAVRELVLSVVRYLNSHPFSSSEEILSHLPTTDDNFHWSGGRGGGREGGRGWVGGREGEFLNIFI